MTEPLDLTELHEGIGKMCAAFLKGMEPVNAAVEEVYQQLLEAGLVNQPEHPNAADLADQQEVEDAFYQWAEDIPLEHRMLRAAWKAAVEWERQRRYDWDVSQNDD